MCLMRRHKVDTYLFNASVQLSEEHFETFCVSSENSAHEQAKLTLSNITTIFSQRCINDNVLCKLAEIFYKEATAAFVVSILRVLWHNRKVA